VLAGSSSAVYAGQGWGGTGGWGGHCHHSGNWNHNKDHSRNSNHNGTDIRVRNNNTNVNDPGCG
jgi:hypothetical protein